MNILQKIIIVVGLIVLWQTVWAQGKEQSSVSVKGIVYSTLTNRPVEVAAVSCGNFSSTFTNEDGSFSLEIRGSNDVLTITARGYHAKEVRVAGREEIKIYLQDEKIFSFSEEAHLGYYKKKQVNTTQAISSVNTTIPESAKLGIRSGETVFGGRVAGLETRSRSGIKGAGSDIFLRGYSSLYGNNQPLIVVDGMIYDINNYGSSIISGYRSNALAGIAEYDIENVTVVRDAASIYGAKASNGVIFIRTSHASKQATVIDLIMGGNYEMAPNNIPLLASEDYRTYLNEIFLTKGLSADSVGKMPFMNTDPSIEGYYNYRNNTDWQKKVFANNYSSNYALRIKGGDDIALYALTVGFGQQNGTVIGSDNSRFNFRFNSDIKFSQDITLNSNISFFYTKKNISATGIESVNDPVAQARVKAPFLQEYKQNILGIASPDLSDYDFLNISNPVSLQRYGRNEDMNYRLFGSFDFHWALTKNLTISNLVGMSFDKNRQSIFVPGAGVAPISVPAGIIENQMLARVLRHFVINNDFRASYKVPLGFDHKLLLMAGARLNINELEEDWASDFNSPNDQIRSLGNGNYLLRQKGGLLGDWKSLVYYLHSDYCFMNKYLLTLNLGLDGSSRYGIEADGLGINNTKYGVYPGVAFAWVASAEPFLAGVDQLELLKLRVSYGLTGNDDIGNYTAKKYYIERNFLSFQGTKLGNVWNPALGAEKTAKMNVGIDLGLFRERVSVSFDLYSNKTTNMLDYITATTYTGFNGYFANMGGFTTNGFDLSINTRVLNGALKWDIGAVLSKYSTRVDELFDNKRTTDVFGAKILTEVGKPIGVFYGYKTLGVYESDAKAQETGLKNRMSNEALIPFRAGDMIYEEVVKDGIIDANDMQVIGDPTPDFTGEVFTQLKFKQLSLSASLGFSYGNDVYNYYRYSLENMSTTNNQTQAVLNRWRYQGQTTNIPRAEFGDPMGNARFSDRWIEDGSYARLKNVTLSYMIPFNTDFVKYAEIYVSGINLLTFTNYLGLDPDFSLNGFSLSQGVDVGLIPQNRMVLLGVRIGL